jgi:hypothetical protein
MVPHKSLTIDVPYTILLYSAVAVPSLPPPPASDVNIIDSDQYSQIIIAGT